MGVEVDLVEEFAARVISANPMHAKFLNGALSGINRETRQQLDDYIRYCRSIGLEMDYIVACYNTITRDTQNEQLFFFQNKRYRWSRFSEVAEQVYFDDQYMRKYMYGLALTSFIWPNHIAMHEFYLRTFPVSKTGTYLEIGPGHGYYLMQAAKIGRFDRLVGVDISASSVALTRDILDYFKAARGRQVEIIQTDFLNFDPNETYSCIVMGEVLEHVEDPARFLRKIASLSSADTHVYVTTCVNAPAVDHIFLYRAPAEVEAMAEDSGFNVVDKFYGPYFGKTVDESVKMQLPINVAYVLKKA